MRQLVLIFVFCSILLSCEKTKSDEYFITNNDWVYTNNTSTITWRFGKGGDLVSELTLNSSIMQTAKDLNVNKEFFIEQAKQVNFPPYCYDCAGKLTWEINQSELFIYHNYLDFDWNEEKGWHPTNIEREYRYQIQSISKEYLELSSRELDVFITIEFIGAY